MEGRKGPRKRRKFSEEFKAETVRLVRTSGKPLAQIAGELDLTDGTLEARPERAQPGHLIDGDRLADPLDASGAERLEREVPLHKLAHRLADGDRTRRGERLQPCRQTGGVSDGHVLGVGVARFERARTTTSPVFRPTRASNVSPFSARRRSA
jgi:transposase